MKKYCKGKCTNSYGKCISRRKTVILREYHEWKKTFPKDLCDRTEKALQKARLKNTIAEPQKKLDAMEDE